METEIGISRDSEEEIDVVAESIALVRSSVEPGIWMRWDYGSEDPHADMRGFRVRELRQDTDEANYYTQDAERELSFAEIKSDFVLTNGARFYNDHAHPEYCTPECSTLAELIAHDRAGDKILMACAEHLSRESGSTVRLYKNNTDFFGHSYGCHENYLLPRSLPWETLAQKIQAFLVTRQIFAGAGKFGVETEDAFLRPGFQISQRSDFFSELQSVDTMQRRPIVNTRDEPHANPKKFRRFHVIIGDANMSSFATRLKVGSTALVLEAIVRDPQRVYPLLADPLGALREISLDSTFKWAVSLKDQSLTSAIEIQRQYLSAVKDLCELKTAEQLAIVGDWEKILADLESNILICGDRLDWVAKWTLIKGFQEQQKLASDDPWLRSLDLEYHRLNLEEGLYYGLEQNGSIRKVIGDSAVMEAMHTPPLTTRAYVRGRCIKKFPQEVISAQWDHITLQGTTGPIKISLLDLFDPQSILHYARIVDAAMTPDDLSVISERSR
ncbi:MAG: proteasome accessory factor PafA2 family protein [Verrucomicrobiota bacterium]|nr:proteasome accessory factor PafA2 family protein [Verrucomicrobiota bacterium]